MLYSPNDGIIPNNENLWLMSANDDLAGAKELLELGRNRLAVLTSVYAVEKVLKYILQTEGKLSNSDNTHNLYLLAKRLSFFSEMPPSIMETMRVFSTLHVSTSYPISEVMFNTVSDKMYAVEQYNHAKRAIGWLLGRANQQGDSDE